MINIQPAEKQSTTSDLDVHSIFETIQGEGPNCGQPSIFIRLAGCNLQCPACDTDYTQGRAKKTVSGILEEVEAAGPWKLAVLTGGEPFRQNIAPLVSRLLTRGFRVQIETNGTLFNKDLPYNTIEIVCSPKTPNINPNLYNHITALKYVVRAGSVDPEDGLPIITLGHDCGKKVFRARAWPSNRLYVQPEDEQDDEKNKLNLQACVNSCMKFGYTLQLQIHKLIGVK
jgi:7-carboxy-7-deazaguanine synthase